jgi:predicted nucleotidyltransferase
MDRIKTVARLLESVTAWVKNRPDVQAAALVGSYAREAATERSDVDLLILTTEVEKYFQSPQWMSIFGEVDEYDVENWGKVEALRVFYKNAVEVEYNFSTPDWADIPVDEGTRRVVIGGLKILFDPQDILKRLQETVAATK